MELAETWQVRPTESYCTTIYNRIYNCFAIKRNKTKTKKPECTKRSLIFESSFVWQHFVPFAVIKKDKGFVLNRSHHVAKSVVSMTKQGENKQLPFNCGLQFKAIVRETIKKSYPRQPGHCLCDEYKNTALF